MSRNPPRGISQGLAGCHACGKVSPESAGRCARCGSKLHIRKPYAIQRTVALLIAATALYVPANVLPIMVVSEIGGTTASTIFTGMIDFWNSGAYPIAIVIFTASLFIPIVKIVALIWLCAAASGKVHPSPKVLGKIYWFTELMGRWSMVDIFVVAILVAIVQLGAVMTVMPGPGALAFAGVVVLTMFAAMSFDPRLLWDQLELMESPPKEEQ
jgi:paraquat-inducible protein A